MSPVNLPVINTIGGCLGCAVSPPRGPLPVWPIGGNGLVRLALKSVGSKIIKNNTHSNYLISIMHEEEVTLTRAWKINMLQHFVFSLKMA